MKVFPARQFSRLCILEMAATRKCKNKEKNLKDQEQTSLETLKSVRAPKQIQQLCPSHN